jgi:PhoPQ-activated pathogenicity-related protein
MMRYWRRLPAVCLWSLLLCGAARADLLNYVHRADKVYRWEKRSEIKKPQGTVYDLFMVSQQWQGMVWEHRIQVFAPNKVEFPGAAVLLITGGGGSDEETALGLLLANATGVPIAVLYHIPNQPLFDGRSEDALIAYTFDRYLETGDDTWPLLFPMTKSALRAMDTLQAWAKQEGMPPLTRFIVTGASKRGWTTWLTAATGDPRVKAIMPMVYDNLNLPAQMPHQLAQWGQYSEMIQDYTKRGLQQKMNSPRGAKLSAMVDPYTFRKALSMPKLILNGTNDPYWAQDALNLYWDGLNGPKWVLYATNSGHGLDNRLPILSAVTAFVRAIASGKLPPQPSWKYESTDSGARLVITSEAAKSARLWTARSGTQDFRKARWESAPMPSVAGGFAADVARPASGYLAVFGEVTLESGGRSFPTSTQIRILAAK